MWYTLPVKIAVVGSRDYPHLEDVRALVQLIATDRPDATIISGGAKGVDTTAEQEAAQAGLKVTSFRVRSVNRPNEPEEYGIEEWAFGSQKSYVRLMLEEPTFSDYTSGLNYRNSLIAERADRIVAFKGFEGRGTSLTLDFGVAYDRPEKIYGVDADRFVAA